MFDRNLVTSGFDTETLVSERYLSFLLLAQIDAFPALELPISGTNLKVRIHPPLRTQFERDEYIPNFSDAWEKEGSFEVKLLPGNTSGFCDIATNADGTRLFTRSLDSIVRIWDVAGRRQVTDEENPIRVDPAIGSAFNAACTQIATASADHNVRIWEFAAPSSPRVLSAHTNVVECVAFSPDGLLLASGSFDQTIKIWELATGNVLRTLTGHTGRVVSVAFNPAGDQLVSAGEDQSVRVWSVTSGVQTAKLTGHTEIVNCAVFSPNGLRVASCSDDMSVRTWDPSQEKQVHEYRDSAAPGTVAHWVDFHIHNNRAHLVSGASDGVVRVWNVAPGNALPGPPPDPVTRYATFRNAEHRSAVIRTRFFGGLHGTRTVSASSGGSIRIWNPNEDAMGFEMRQEFMSVRLSVSLLNSNTAELYAELNLGIILNLALNATRENGLERDHDLRLSFARLDEATIARLEVYGLDVAKVEDLLRTGLDRSLPTGVPEGQQVQQVRLKKHFDAGRATLGIYVDLALKHVDEDGNITFRRPRGIHGAEQDFRPAEHDIAFATSPQLLAMLGPDAKQRAARPRPDGAIYYPLTEDGLGGTGEIIGKIYDVSVGPRRIAQPNGPAAPAGQLAMHLDILYTKDGVDAGLVAHAYFAPQRTSKKFVEWASELDIDLGVLAKFAVAILGLAFLFIPAGLVGWGLLTFLSVGAFTGITAAAIVEACVAKTLADKVGLEKQAGILDVLPFHIPATDRRNDPFYMMQYQIHAKLDEAVIIDDAGIAFAASDLALKRVPVPQTDVAIRGVEREGGEVTAIHFEVPDFEQLAHRFEQTGPGVDRRSFIRRDVLNAPTIVTLTLAEVLARKAERRVPAPILLEARRVHLAQGRIEHLLCITWRERSVERRRLIREFQQNAREGVIAGELSAIKTAAEAALIARLNRTPSREEREGEIQRRIEGRVAVLQATYEEVSLPGELDAALAPLLRVELAPRELAALQKEGIAVLDGKEIIYRKDANGTPVPYFRDHPDAIKKDNLLALPRYSPPYAPPPA